MRSAELFVVVRNLLYFLTVLPGHLNNVCMLGRATAHLANLLPTVLAATFLSITNASLGLFDVTLPLLSPLWWLIVRLFRHLLSPRRRQS